MKKIALKNATVTQHIFGGQVSTSVSADAFEVLKEIGLITGLYSAAEDASDCRVMVIDHDGHRTLVVEEDISYHGSPCWVQKRVLETDPERIEEYLTFEKAMAIVKKRLSES